MDRIFCETVCVCVSPCVRSCNSIHRFGAFKIGLTVTDSILLLFNCLFFRVQSTRYFENVHEKVVSFQYDAYIYIEQWSTNFSYMPKIQSEEFWNGNFWYGVWNGSKPFYRCKTSSVQHAHFQFSFFSCVERWANNECFECVHHANSIPYRRRRDEKRNMICTRYDHLMSFDILMDGEQEASESMSRERMTSQM